MVSTFTPNIQLEEPARGDYVGTWDTPVNANMTLIDLILGGRTTVSGAAGSVVLAAAQYQCKTITFNSTLLASITVTFPTSFTKSYEIYNTCTGSSAFVVTLQTTAAGGQVVCCPPGEIFEMINDGANIRFKNFGRVGSYWDYAGSSVPAWVSGCTVAPYLNCDATSFSSATFPQLATILGSTTLPDFRGRKPHFLNQGTGRLTSTGAGIDGNTIFAAGGTDGTVLSTSHIPTLTAAGINAISVTAPNNTLWGGNSAGSLTGGGALPGPVAGTGATYSSSMPSTGNNNITVAYTNSSSPTSVQTSPGLVGGLRLIRTG